MAINQQAKAVIGRAEHLSFPELGLDDVPARIDTGARTSSIWASHIALKGGVLTTVLFGEGNDLHSGTLLEFAEYDTTVVSTSTGEEQQRYKVRLLVKLKGKKIRAWFTLADRSTQVYPVLIGRNVLLGKFIVDVKKGQALKDKEQQRTQELRAKMHKLNKEES